MRSWQRCRVGNTAVVKGMIGGPFGSSLVSNDYVLSGIPVIRGSNLAAGQALRGDYVYVSEDKVQRDLARNTAQPGDLIFTQRGTLGQVAMVPADGYSRYVISQSQMRLRVDPRVAVPLFVYFACSAPEFRKQIEDNAIATGVPHINLGILARLEIPLPPVEDQKAIAEVLGALDDKITTNHAASAACDQLAETVFSRLHEIGSGQTSVGNLIESGALLMSDGYRTKRSELDISGYRIVRVADVRGGVVHLDSPDFVSAGLSAAIGVKRGVPGDILLTTKGTVGRVAVLPPTDSPVVYSPQLCFFRVLSEELITRAFLRMWLTGAEFRVQASHRMNNTDMAPYINLADVKSLRITLPPMSDQAAISGLLDALENRSQAAHLENQTLAALRDTLLPELMSGRLRVKDAEATLAGVL